MINMRALVIAFGLATAIFAAHGQATVPQTDQTPQPGRHESKFEPAPVQIPAAEQPSKEQLAKLFEVMRLRDQMQNVMRMVPDVVRQQVQSQFGEITARLAPGAHLTPEQQAKLEDLMNKYIAKSMTVYTVDNMIADMTGVYQHHLSRTDVDGLIAFYTSPVGQHLLDAQPSIMKEYMPMVMQRQQKGMQELTDEMQKDLEDFTKSVAAGATTPASK